MSSQGYIAAYSGCVTSGSPVDAFSQVQSNTAAAITLPSITTTQINDMLVMLAHNWTGSGALSPPTGMTERLDIVVYAADEVRAASGATGTRVQTLTVSNQPSAGFLVALKGAS